MVEGVSSTTGEQVSMPAWILPGMADNVLQVAFGHGRTASAAWATAWA
jgi:hypothetical protein